MRWGRFERRVALTLAAQFSQIANDPLKPCQAARAFGPRLRQRVAQLDQCGFLKGNPRFEFVDPCCHRRARIVHADATERPRPMP